jgi:hypothetical protein
VRLSVFFFFFFFSFSFDPPLSAIHAQGGLCSRGVRLVLVDKCLFLGYEAVELSDLPQNVARDLMTTTTWKFASRNNRRSYGSTVNSEIKKYFLVVKGSHELGWIQVGDQAGLGCVQLHKVPQPRPSDLKQRH